MGSMQPVGELDRQRYLGGSDIAAILGISPWRTPLDVYLDKTEGRQPEDPSKAKIFRRGARMEPYILDLLAEEHGIEIVARNNRYIDPVHGFLAAEIDAESATGENIEAKSANQFAAKNWGEQGTDEIPVYYSAQGMHGMMITGAPATIFPVLIGSDDFRVYRLERDEELIGIIREKEVEFWDRIQRREPPEPTTAADLLRLHPKSDGAIIQASDAILDRYNEMKAMIKRRDMLDSDIEDAKLELQMFMRQAGMLKFGATPLCTWREQDTTRFSLEPFRNKYPKLAKKFSETTTSRVFRVR